MNNIRTNSFANNIISNKENFIHKNQKVAEGLSENFYKMMLKEIWKPVEGEFGGGYAEEQIHDILLDEHAKLMSKFENSPLTRSIYKTMNSDETNNKSNQLNIYKNINKLVGGTQ